MGKEAEEQEKAEGTRYLDFGRACGTLHVVLLEAPSLISSEIGLQMFESLFEFSRILCQMSGGSWDGENLSSLPDAIQYFH